MTQTPLSPSDSETPAEIPTLVVAAPSENPAGKKPISLEKIDPDAIRVVQRLRRFNHAAYLVGGCVRDVLLNGKPKDFDVATSATPNELRRLFRNCRIIGRRFRLAHIFFGRKIIETSTFRANPREEEDDVGTTPAAADDAPAEKPAGRPADLLIRRDNVFGTAEEDARRRDFTINGLFLDVDTSEIIDHVHGLPDIEARLVRTIGDPDIRFREDPIRILRAVKFAARCNLTIEPETYQSAIDHKLEIAKCPPARVSEEFFRLLRMGAAKRSMDLLVEMDILSVLSPSLARWLTPVADDETRAEEHKRFWRYLEALDAVAVKRETPPSNALVLATMMVAPLRGLLDADTSGKGDVGARVMDLLTPLVDELKASRRDSDLARQLLLVLRNALPSAQGRRRARPGPRELYDDTLSLVELVGRAEERADIEAEVARLATELAPVAVAQMPSHLGAHTGRGAPLETVARDERGMTPIPNVAWPTAAFRPAFLGTGGFGGPWSRAD